MEIQKIWFQRKLIAVDMISVDGKVIASFTFDNGTTAIGLNSAEIRELFQKGKISDQNIEILEPMKKQFLAHFPLENK